MTTKDFFGTILGLVEKMASWLKIISGRGAIIISRYATFQKIKSLGGRLFRTKEVAKEPPCNQSCVGAICFQFLAVNTHACFMFSRKKSVLFMLRRILESRYPGKIMLARYRL